MRSECITDKEREKTKRIVYSLIYGMGQPARLYTHCYNYNCVCIIGKEKLSQLLNISLESAQQLTTSFLSNNNCYK